MAAQALGLHDLYLQFKAIAYGIWRKRWYMIVTTWFIALIGWSAVSTMPYRYEATARVSVDADTLLPSLVGKIGSKFDTGRKVEAIRTTLVSRPNIEKIIRRSVYLERLTQSPADLDALITKLSRDIRIVPLTGGVYRIEFEIDEGRLRDRERAEVAKIVVSNLLSFFRERALGSENGQVGNASDFLEKQLADYGTRLVAAEASHAKFKQDNIEYLGNINFITRLEKARSDLQNTRGKIAELTVTQRTLETQLANVPATIREPARSAGGGIARDPLEERIAEANRKLDKLRGINLLDGHPDVRALLLQIKQLEEELVLKKKEIEAELADSASAGKNSTLTTETPNRLYEQLMLENISTLGQIAALEQREIDQKLMVEELQGKAKRVPAIEAEERELKRGYENLRSQHRKFQKQLAEVEILGSIESNEKSVAFRVIDEPVIPQQPSGPPRLLFMSAVFIGALVAGLGVALVLSQLRPVVITVEQLRSHFDLPVLGNVTRSLSERESQQRSFDMMGFAGVSALLFIVFSGFILWDMFGGPTLG